MITSQVFVSLSCPKCNAKPLGLSPGPAESARVKLLGDPRLTICPKCQTPEQADKFRDQVDQYYHAKTRNAGG